MNEGKKDRRDPIRTVKPRNFVAKNAGATTSGAGAHKDKKKAAKQGETKHKNKEYAEGLQDKLNVALAEASSPAQQAAIAINMKKHHQKPKNENSNPEYDDEAGMSYGSLHTISRAANGLLDTIKEGDNLPEWCQEKISLAEDYLITVWDYLQSEKEQGVAEGLTGLSIQQLATISDEALDNAYHYGRSQPGNTFGWQANLKSAAYAKQMIDKGVTDIEAISDAIHKGWNVTAQAFVKNPDQFSDTEKLKAAGKLEAKLQQRAQLMKQNYAQLPEEEKEKDRVVARELLRAITGQQGVAEGSGGAKYKIKQIGSEGGKDYYISPNTGKKVYKKAKVGDHETPDGEHKPEARMPYKEGAKVDRQAKHITTSMMKKGKSKKDAEAIAWAHIKHPKKKANEGWTHDSLADQLFEHERTYEEQLQNKLNKQLGK